MDVVLMIIYALLMLSFLVVIHEGGHYLASRAFGVRVTEFMVGMPGPNIGVTIGGTKFGITPILLGGYAKVCGMEADPISPHTKAVLASLYRRGTANMEDVARDCGITDDEAYDVLEALTEWGSVVGPLKADKYNTYRTPACKPTRRQRRDARKQGLPAPPSFAQGQPREVPDEQALYDSEFRQQYCSLPFWKRSVILVAGPLVNLIFTVLVFVLIYSVIGFDVTYTSTGETVHMTVGPLTSIQVGFAYLGMVVEAVASLFNPATAAETISNSTSIVGVAAMSVEVVEAGATSVLLYMAMISASLGVMNLLPIPPLDGGRFVVEVYQKIRRRGVRTETLNKISMAGMALFMVLFVVLVGQDIDRFVLGNWD